MTCKQCRLEKRTRWAEGMYAESAISQIAMALSQAETAGKRALKELSDTWKSLKGHRPLGQLARERKEQAEQMAIHTQLNNYTMQYVNLRNRIYDLAKRQKRLNRTVEQD